MLDIECVFSAIVNPIMDRQLFMDDTDPLLVNVGLVYLRAYYVVEFVSMLENVQKTC